MYALTAVERFTIKKTHQEAIQLQLAVFTAPALAIPNYGKVFFLFCHELDGQASGVLTQKHRGKQRPVAYVSCALDHVIKGSPSCVRSVAAAALLMDKVADFVLGQPNFNGPTLCKGNSQQSPN